MQKEGRQPGSDRPGRRRRRNSPSHDGSGYFCLWAKYAAALIARSGLSRNMPRPVLHGAQRRPRTLPVLWQWSIYSGYCK